MAGDAHLRIGELGRRSGVSVELLRAWERRYGVLRPQRSAGGLRLYSSGDLDRVRAMQRHMHDGLAAREAAPPVGQGSGGPANSRPPTPPFHPGPRPTELGDPLWGFGGAEAQA